MNEQKDTQLKELQIQIKKLGDTKPREAFSNMEWIEFAKPDQNSGVGIQYYVLTNSIKIGPEPWVTFQLINH